ncbi:MAG: hypothetical protein KDD45_05580, partial [Bdellovibrionales bacterium]|nr:hypothetical protein [Bdellovibrionales bacterium]
MVIKLLGIFIILAVSFNACSPFNIMTESFEEASNDSHSLKKNSVNSLYQTPNSFCHAWVLGNDASGNNVLSNYMGNCLKGEIPSIFSITHENKQNTHFGDANYRAEISSYMADYNPEDLGTWFDYATLNTKTSGKGFSLKLD